MSAALFAELEKLRTAIAQLGGALDGVRADQARLCSDLEALEGDQSSQRALEKRLASLEASFSAMREAIESDAREILGATRDRIDPAKVEMPPVLRTMGYSKERL